MGSDYAAQGAAWLAKQKADKAKAAAAAAKGTSTTGTVDQRAAYLASTTVKPKLDAATKAHATYLSKYSAMSSSKNYIDIYGVTVTSKNTIKYYFATGFQSSANFPSGVPYSGTYEVYFSGFSNSEFNGYYSSTSSNVTDSHDLRTVATRDLGLSDQQSLSRIGVGATSSTNSSGWIVKGFISNKGGAGTSGNPYWIEVTRSNPVVTGNAISTNTTLSGAAIISTAANVGAKYYLINQLMTEQQKYIDAYTEQYNAAQKALGKGTKNDITKANDGAPAGVIDYTKDTGQVAYNIGSVNDAYFSRTSGFGKNVSLITQDNRPAKVHDADKLWKDGNSHKGMIQSYIIPKAIDKAGNRWVQPELFTVRDVNKSRYGFQFLYNPGSVSMEYAGSPAVDIGLEISGKDKIPLVGSAASSSTISFQILINRMSDMKYIDTYIQNAKNTRNRAATGTLGDNVIDISQVYGPVDVSQQQYVSSTETDLEVIRSRGTMYDVEFLLRTLLGYAIPSSLRGNISTADIGYLGAYPVELHLGKNLRYLVTINDFRLEHTVFTHDMVPVFTNLTLSCSRLPDFNYAQSRSASTAYKGSK